ncbi:hypothetical protein [Plesiomonas shigelloides]|uniref:hypothetical protein n=1 Tax=Plesiomonas shigelloides TaxID=703 RepID=UPI0015B5CD96|nr:hypothetical protein [Plesiomonas shigelloides]
MNCKHAELLNQAAHNRQLGDRSRAALFLSMAGTERLIVMMEKMYARKNREGWALA